MKAKKHETNHENIHGNFMVCVVWIFVFLKDKKRAALVANRRRSRNPRDFLAPALSPRIRGDFHSPLPTSACVQTHSSFGLADFPNRTHPARMHRQKLFRFHLNALGKGVEG